MGGPDDTRERTTSDLADELLRTSPTGAPGVTGSFLPPRRPSVRRRLGNLLTVLGAFTGLLAVLYVVDLLDGIGEVPRGTVVAGVDIGGLSTAEAEDTLRREVGPRVLAPVEVTAGTMSARLDPADAGLGVDWAATVDRAGTQPWEPLSRVTSFFEHREAPLVPSVDPAAVRAALHGLAAQLDRPVVDGGIWFRPLEGEPDHGAVEARVLEPRQGVRLGDLDEAVRAVRAQWPHSRRIELPVWTTEPKWTSEAVHATLRRDVLPLVSGPIVLRGDGGEAVLLPAELTKAMRFADDGRGGLDLTLDQAALRAAVGDELTSTEKAVREAALTFRDGIPGTVPSVRGTRVDWEQTFARLAEVADSGERREVWVSYDVVEPEVTTQDVERLGIREVVGKATGPAPSADLLPDVRGLAGAVSGVIVGPGETFDLARHAGSSGSSTGDGPESATLTGGQSGARFVDTLRDAVRSAGLRPVERGPGSFAFTNDTGAALAVRAAVTNSEVEVTLWGTPTR